ncbi:hypothetical protein L1049_026962 [Liquidambar formosana]|uniref:Aminotransferase class I/classII large domain-containing protein n=1 Tax=Liquidambar formosana TaxID=63359 RepID=A0AAP0NFV3_LIQFO
MKGSSRPRPKCQASASFLPKPNICSPTFSPIRLFTSSYIEKNQRRLRKRKEVLVSGLANAGIRCLKSNAGLFCWVDMRHLLSSYTFEAEMELWIKILREVGLNVSPGSSCHCTEPGWFRMCFANMSEETLNLSMQRIKAFVDSTAADTRRRSPTKWIFQLSSYDREADR